MRSTTQDTVSRKIHITRTENQGIKNKILVQKSHHTDHGDSQYGAQDVFAQFGDMLEKMTFRCGRLVGARFRVVGRVA